MKGRVNLQQEYFSKQSFWRMLHENFSEIQKKIIQIVRTSYSWKLFLSGRSRKKKLFLFQGLFFNKVACLWHSCFLVNFAKFLRTPPDDCFLSGSCRLYLWRAIKYFLSNNLLKMIMQSSCISIINVKCKCPHVLGKSGLKNELASIQSH